METAENQKDAGGKEHYALRIADDDMSMFGEEDAAENTERQEREERIRISRENFEAGRADREEYIRIKDDVRKAEKKLQRLLAKETTQEREAVQKALQALSESVEELVKYRKAQAKPQTGKTYAAQRLWESRS